MTALTVGLEGGLERGVVDCAFYGDHASGGEFIAGLLGELEEEPAFGGVVGGAVECCFEIDFCVRGGHLRPVYQIVFIPLCLWSIP